MSRKKQNKHLQLPASHDLVPVGPRHVQSNYHRKRDENGLKPSTSRALILRNGKYGARGTGEVILAGRITGREKLDLLAGTFTSFLLSHLLTTSPEDLISQKSRTALMAPFRLDKCIRIADSQYNGMLSHFRPVSISTLTLFKLTSTTLLTSRILTCSTIGLWPSYSRDLLMGKMSNNLFGTLHTSPQSCQQGIGFMSHHLYITHHPSGYTMPTWSLRHGNLSSTPSATSRILI